MKKEWLNYDELLMQHRQVNNIFNLLLFVSGVVTVINVTYPMLSSMVFLWAVTIIVHNQKNYYALRASMERRRR